MSAGSLALKTFSFVSFDCFSCSFVFTPFPSHIQWNDCYRGSTRMSILCSACQCHIDNTAKMYLYQLSFMDVTHIAHTFYWLYSNIHWKVSIVRSQPVVRIFLSFIHHYEQYQVIPITAVRLKLNPELDIRVLNLFFKEHQVWAPGNTMQELFIWAVFRLREVFSLFEISYYKGSGKCGKSF